MSDLRTHINHHVTIILGLYLGSINPNIHLSECVALQEKNQPSQYKLVEPPNLSMAFRQAEYDESKINNFTLHATQDARARRITLRFTIIDSDTIASNDAIMKLRFRKSGQRGMNWLLDLVIVAI